MKKKATKKAVKTTKAKPTKTDEKVIPEVPSVSELIETSEKTYEKSIKIGENLTKAIEELKNSSSLKVKKLHPDAKLPVRAKEFDAGMDIFALESFELAKYERKLVKTGIAIEIPEGYSGELKEKSGLATKYGLQVLAGIVDTGYTGEILVCLHNPRGHIIKDGKKIFNEKIKFEAGQKICQLVLEKIDLPEIVEVEELSDSDRGDGGFGSTGS